VEYGIGGLKKIKPLMEIYEKELVLYAVHTNIPFQTEECPYKDESIRSAFRVHLNNLEKIHPGIKYNAYKSILKIAKRLKESPANTVNTTLTTTNLSTDYVIGQEHRKCELCNRDSSNKICSVCRTLNILTEGN